MYLPQDDQTSCPTPCNHFFVYLVDGGALLKWENLFPSEFCVIEENSCCGKPKNVVSFRVGRVRGIHEAACY